MMTPFAFIVSLSFFFLYLQGAESYLGVCAGNKSCTAKYKILGCYNDNELNRILPHEILNARDPTRNIYIGQPINWYNWNYWLPDFVCKCAEKAAEMNYNMFGVEFYGECWAGNATGQSLEAHGKSSSCCGGDYKPCADPNDHFCSGTQNTITIYEVVQTTCDIEFEPIGCFDDNHHAPRPLPNYTMNERDNTISNWDGRTIDWRNWDTYLPQFACRCAQAAKKVGHDWFGLQFYGECWTSFKATYAIDSISPEGCENTCYDKCVDSAPYCAGRQFHNYVYRIKNGQNCELTINEVGCYEENPTDREFSNHIFSATGPSDMQTFYGKLLDSSNWESEFPDFLCRCARASLDRFNHTVFGITDKGGCYSTAATNAYSNLDNSDGCRQGGSEHECTPGAKKCAGWNQGSVCVYTVERRE